MHDIIIKYNSIKLILAVLHNIHNGNLYVPYFYYMLMNAVPTALGALLVSYIEVCFFFITN